LVVKVCECVPIDKIIKLGIVNEMNFDFEDLSGEKRGEIGKVDENGESKRLEHQNGDTNT